MWYEDFQDGCHGGHLGYQNETILAILNLHAAPMPSTKFPLHPTYCSGADNNWSLSRWPPWRASWIQFWWRCQKCEKVLTDIRMRDGPWLIDHGISWPCGHRRYRNKLFLAILNLHINPMPPTKFWLNPTYHSGVDVVWRFSRWPSWGPSQILDQNYVSNSDSLCHSDASNQVWAQSALRFGRRCLLKNFKMAPWLPSWMSEWNEFSSSESPCLPNDSHQVSA